MNLKTLLVGIIIYSLVTLNLIYFFFYQNDPSQDHASNELIAYQKSLLTIKSDQEQTSDSQLQSPAKSSLSSAEKPVLVEEPSDIIIGKEEKTITTSREEDNDAHVSMLLKLLTDNTTMFNQLKKEVLNQELRSQDSFLRSDVEVLKKYARSSINPFLRLGLYERIGDTFEISDMKDSKGTLKTINGFQHNERYCEELDFYALLHQNQIFNQANFISDYSEDELFVRNLTKQELGGDDLFPDLNSSSSNSQTLKSLPLNVSAFFLKKSQMLNHYEVNKEIICFSQMFNHIPGQGELVRNDLLFKNMMGYFWTTITKSQGKEKVAFPWTFRLDNATECQRFFLDLSALRKKVSKNDEPIQYILKNMYGDSSAAEPFDEIQEERLYKKFEGGMWCGGGKKEAKTIQRYITNPLLLDKGNKFGLKMYMLVASTKPLIVYYHDGFLQVSLFKYDKTFQEKDTNITNIHFTRQDIGETIDHDFNDEELEEYKTWLMDDLQSYLLEKGKISNNTWLEEELRPKLQRTLAHIIKMIEASLYKTSSAFELFELDFQVDDNLEIWFVDARSGISTSDSDSKRTSFFSKMLKDMFEIQYSYYKSKMRRAFNFVNNLLKNAQTEEDMNSEKLKEEFDTNINVNKLESEFAIKGTNGFRFLMDQNTEDIGANSGPSNEDLLEKKRE